MAGTARHQVVREGEIGTYHCWSKCTQRAFLCGQDSETGINFDYRRGWVEGLIQYQSGVFAVDVGNHSVLSNHVHVIVRTRPDIVATWSDEEVACRWRAAWPRFVDGRWVRQVSEEEVRELLLNPEKIAWIRQKLSSLSWFMARSKEPIARLCNAEMGVDGHFWNQRFGCRELLDDSAVLVCHLYVDLNQINAGLADSLPDSRHSGICNRIAAAKAREVVASMAAFEGSSDGIEHQLPPETLKALFADCFLAPIGPDGPLMTETALRGAADEQPVSLDDASGKTELSPAEGREVAPTVAPGETPADRAVEREGPAPAEPLAGESEAALEGASPISNGGGEAAGEPDPADPGVASPSAKSPSPVTEPGASPSDAPKPLAGESEAAPDGSFPISNGGGEAEAEADPVDPAEPVKAAEVASESVAGDGDSGSGIRTITSASGRCRASDNPILAIPLEQYLALAQQLANDALFRRSGEITEGGLNGLDSEAIGILEAHGLNAAACATQLNQLETRCRRAFGAARRMSERARAAAQNWFHGIGFCRDVFVDLEDHT